MIPAITKIRPVATRLPSTIHRVRHYKQSSLSQRLAEKMHRSEFHKVIRPSKKYNQSVPNLKPTLSHFLVEYSLFHKHRDAEGTEAVYNVGKVSEQWKYNPRKLGPLLEPIMYNVLSASLDSASDLEWYKKSKADKLENIKEVLRKFPGAMEDTKELCLKHTGEDLDAQVEKFAEISSIDLATTDGVILESAVALFLLVVKKGSLPYTVTDLAKWYLSFVAEDVTGACEALTELNHIPSFVVLDILSRGPRSGHHLALQLDLWHNFTAKFVLDPQVSAARFQDVLTNTVLTMIPHNTFQIRDFLRSVVSDVSHIKGNSFSSAVFDDRFINSLLWDIAYDAYKRASLSWSQYYDVVSVQEYLSSLLTTSETGIPNLTLQSQMGIVLAISHISKDKAGHLFVNTRKKFSTRQHELSTKDITALNLVRMALSETPGELLDAFNDMPNHRHQASVWFAFVKRLNHLNILTFERSHKILTTLLKDSDSILLTKDILVQLLIPVKKKLQFSHMLTTLLSYNFPLNTIRAALLEKYLTLLYRKPKQFTSSWVTGLLLPEVKVRDTVNCLHLAKVIYFNYPFKKPVRLIASMLQGVAQVKPRVVYELYKAEIIDQGLVPDHGSLTALLVAAKSKPGQDSDECLTWGDLYAPQVAIKEFRQYVAQDADDTNAEIRRPPAELWNSYINLLRKYGYVSELSEIIGWWERLQYTPKRTSLLALLKALPSEFATRHIKHIEKVRADSEAHAAEESGSPRLVGSGGIIDWPWPEIEELEETERATPRIPRGPPRSKYTRW